MKSAPPPDNETERLALLKRLEILDTVEEQPYDDLTFLAASICETPIALVCLIDQDRQWFKSHLGLDTRETPREYAFCTYAILEGKTFIVPSAREDARFSDNPLVAGDPKIQFYAGVPLELENGLNVGTLCVIDRKPRELTQEQLKGLEAISRQAVAQLNLRLKIKEFQHLCKTEIEFISMVTHELKTPVASISGSLALLCSNELEPSSSKYQEMIGIAYHNAQNLTKIINDILDIAKFNAGKFKIDPQENDINQSIKEAISLIDTLIKQHRIQVELSLDSSIPLIKFDKSRIIQVLENLLSNAIKFSPEGSKIIVSSTKQEHSVQVSIQDFGMGIAQNQIKEIFNQYPNASEHPTIGTGLGLNIVKQIIDVHNGTINFTSEEGKGTTFFFDLKF